MLSGGEQRRVVVADSLHALLREMYIAFGILDEFLERPHQEVRELAGRIGGETVAIADFRHLPARCKFVAFMPQWDFLDFLAARAQRHPTFSLHRAAEVRELIEEHDAV